MFRKTFQLAASFAVVFSLLFAAVPALALTTPTAKGTVISINKRTHVMNIKNSKGKIKSLKYNSKTVLRVNGQKVALRQLHVGNHLSMKYRPTTGTSTDGVALDGDDSPEDYDLSGIVAAVDTVAGTVDIASDDGGSTVTLNVDSSTVITRDDAPATLADLVFGDEIEATYDSATMLASTIDAQSNEDNSEVEGLILSIDQAAGTVTIDNQDAGTTVTLQVDSSTFIMFDDSPGTLADLQVGFEIEGQFDPITMHANYIEVQSE